jgi:rhodanese-related sulfurtransferase
VTSVHEPIGRARTVPKATGPSVATVMTVSGVYAKEAGKDPKIARARDMVAAFVDNDGGPPRILIAKLGQDGHDRGQKVIATAYGDLGLEATAGALFQTPAEAARLVAEGKAVLIDVREQDEWEIDHIPQAKLIPLQTIPAHADALPKDTEIIIHCKAGMRSARACEYLMSLGFDNVTNVTGGLDAFRKL